MSIGFAVSRLPPADHWSRDVLWDVATGRNRAVTTPAGERLNTVIPFMRIPPLAQLRFRLRRPSPTINRAPIQPGMIPLAGAAMIAVSVT
jgi:hypothetical protein